MASCRLHTAQLHLHTLHLLLSSALSTDNLDTSPQLHTPRACSSACTFTATTPSWTLQEQTGSPHSAHGCETHRSHSIAWQGHVHAPSTAHRHIVFTAHMAHGTHYSGLGASHVPPQCQALLYITSLFGFIPKQTLKQKFGSK